MTAKIAEFPVVKSRSRVSTEVREIRRANLNLLTQVRGSKQVLAKLCGMSSSRVSLMTTGRKPVSDAFLIAIEEGLGLEKGWLDQPQGVDGVPASAREKLGLPDELQPEALEALQGTQSTDFTAGLMNIEATSTDGVTGNSERPAGRQSLFEKRKGEVGPLAEALARAVIKLSRADKLSEHEAFTLLGELIKKHSD